MVRFYNLNPILSLPTVGKIGRRWLTYSLSLLLFLAYGQASAQTTDDFRSNGAVTFASATNWQRYNGTTWASAGSAPTSTNNAITIRNGHTATVGANVTLDQLTVEGTLQVNTGVTLTLNDGTGIDMTIRRILIIQGTGTVAGAGSFVLLAQARLQTAHASGVAGSITCTTRTFTAGADYVFNGTTAQSTGFAGTSAGNPAHITLSNTAGVTLDQNLTTTGHLNIATNVNFTMGASVTTATFGSIYNRGTVTNCVGATISPAFTNSNWAFPKGTYFDANTTQPATEATLLFFNQASTTAHIYWTNGTGKRRVVVLKPTSAVNVNALTDNTVYTANSNFAGAGSTVDGTGKVVYDGIANEVNVTGLTNATTYHIAVFEYNANCTNTSPNYKTGSPLASSFLTGNRAFITTWQTTTNGESITIPTAGGGYTYDVDWGDATTSTGQIGNATHVYTTAGTYTVQITGAFPRIFFNNTGDKAKILTIQQWGSQVWTSMNGAFNGCNNLTHTATDMPNLSVVTDMSQMFFRANAFNGAIGTWNTNTVISMGGMFWFATAFNQNIGNWNTSAVTNMVNMFTQATAFNQNISNWNTSAVTFMGGMFQNANAFNQNIGSWNTSAVTNMEQMFSVALAFNQNIGTWNTSVVTDMGGMFSTATAFNQNIGGWNTSAVTDMSFMFLQATAFNQNIGTWNTSAVTDMSQMFYQATAFNQNISAWNTNAVTNMSFMFRSATTFNQNIDNWNTSTVTDMGSMFLQATAFNQNIGSWNIGNVTTMINMLDNCGMNTANYDATLIGWAGQTVQPNITLGAIGRTYCSSVIQRATLDNAPNNWTFSGDALSSSCPCQYRTIGNVTFASPTNWERSPDGSTWSVAASAPDAAATTLTITIQNGHTATVGANVTLDELAIESGGTLQINTTRTLTIADGTGTDLTVQSGGTIDIQGTGTLTGAGSFALDAGGTFRTSNANGVNAVGLTGTETYTAGANYEFYGTVAQNTNFPAIGNPNNIIVANTNTTGLTVNNNITMTGTFLVNTNCFVTFNNTNTVGGTGTFTLSSGATLRNAHANGITGSVLVTGTQTFTAGANYVFNGTVAQNTNFPTIGNPNNITVANTNTTTGLTVNNNVTLTGTFSVNANRVVTFNNTNTIVGTGAFTLSSGATLRTANTNGLNCIGVSGIETFTAGANYVFNGTASQIINNPTGISANNFTINNSAGATLSNDITITGVLTLTNGDLDLNGNDITLNGTLAEDRTNNHLVKDLTATSENNQGGGIIFAGNVTNTGTDIAGTGLYLQRNAGSDYAVNVVRKHYQGAYSTQNKGIKRIYQITGSPTGTNTTMRVYYASDELAGITGTYVLCRWQVGTGWKKATDAGSGFANGTNGMSYTEATNINAFSHWTVGTEEAPLPITLLGLKGERVEGLRGEMTEEVKLEWATASEINNKGFEVEMSEDGLAYQKIAFVEGKGNSTTIQPYNHTTIQPYNSYYRLRQIDFDGTFSYSPIVFVEGLVGKVVVYPNPNNGTFNISVGKDALDLPARLLNAVGKEVWRGVQTEVVTTNLPTGVYFLHTTVAGKTNITKIVITR